MNKKNILISAFILIVYISFIYALSINTFTDGKTRDNITFETKGSVYKNISIPFWATITKAEINITVTLTNESAYENNTVLTGAVDQSVRGNNFFAQSFTIGNVSKNETFDVSKITLTLSVQINDDLLYVAIKEVDANQKPTGPDLDNGTFNVSVLTGPFVKYNISLDKLYWLTPGKQYSIFIKSPGAEPSGINIKQTTNNYTGGQGFRTENGGASWNGEEDILFEIWGHNLTVLRNFTIRTNKEITYFNSSFNTSKNNLDLNVSSLQNCVNSVSSGNANCTINFTSDSRGAFEYSDLEINYSVSLDITFKDETSNTLIEGETFEVLLKKIDFSQSFSISNNPTRLNLSTTGLYNLRVSSTNYPVREYNTNVAEARNAITVYLINSTDSSEITFNVVDEGINPLESVRVVFTKPIDGVDTVIAEEDTDFAGQAILNLDSDTKYTINFSKTNYEVRTIDLEPKNSQYVIRMINTIGKYNQSVHEGIRYSFSPSNTILNNNTKYNFTFTLNSAVWDITNCTLNLRNGSILLNSTSSFTSTSCFLRIEQDTGTMTNITSEAIYELSSQFGFTVSQQYKVIYTYEGDFSFKNFLDDLSDFGEAGFDDFGRMILALIVIFVITVWTAQKTSFENKEALILIVIALVWLFSYINWFYLNFTPIPTYPGFDIKKYIIAILITLAGGAFIIEKFTK